MALSWLDWNDDTLARALAERRRIVLLIVARWCRFCRALEASTFADSRVIAAIDARALPVRIDEGVQPDLARAYGQGAWPSTLVLSPEKDVLAAGTFVEADELLAMLDAPERGAPVPAASAPPPLSVPSGLREGILPAIEQALLADFDERWGGFGAGQKFPHPEAIDFALLRLAVRPQPRLREIVEKTLDRMAGGALCDQVDGGFFRFCSRRDWTQPHTEKLLAVNAGLLRNYLEAGQVLGRADFLRQGERTSEALLEHFHDRATGLCHAALAPDDEFYALDAAGRRTRPRPRRDGGHPADGNARAISALLKAGAVLRLPALTATALSIARALLARLWRPGRGVAHDDDGGGRRLPGRLTDQVETARALLHVLQYTDDRRFRAPLDDLLERIAAVHALPGGEFGDEPAAGETGRHRSRDTAILDSAAAAEVLLRGALYTGRSTLAELARGALEVHAQDFRRYGYAMAAYGRSVELVLHPPLHIVVVGALGTARTSELLEAASTTYLPSRVVQRLDPDDDAADLARLELPPRAEPVAYVFVGRECAAAHADPATLWRALGEANRRRLSD